MGLGKPRSRFLAMFPPITTFILVNPNNLMMPDSQDLFTQATELAEQGLLDEALTLFQALLKTDSNNATLGNNIEIIRFRQGKYRKAVNAFGQATDVNGEFTNAWFNKSLALVNLEKDTEALRALDKVLKLNPRDNEAQSQRVLIVRKMAQVSDTGRTDSQSAQSQLRV
jgi:tetratricopeptide (TPR) repeat protein